MAKKEPPHPQRGCTRQEWHEYLASGGAQDEPEVETPKPPKRVDANDNG